MAGKARILVIYPFNCVLVDLMVLKVYFSSFKVENLEKRPSEL